MSYMKCPEIDKFIRIEDGLLVACLWGSGTGELLLMETGFSLKRGLSV